MRKNRDIRSIEKTAVLKGAAVFMFLFFWFGLGVFGLASGALEHWPGDGSDLHVFLLIYKVYCKIIIIIAL